MLVYKFGGGVLGDADGIRKMVEIVKNKVTGSGSGGLVIVVSALGKTTNAFEDLWENWVSGNNTTDSLNKIESFHNDISKALVGLGPELKVCIDDLFNQIRKVLKTSGYISKNQAYDQIVPFGEQLSLQIISFMLREAGIDHSVINAGDIIITDSDFKGATVNFEESNARIREKIAFKNEANGPLVWITQGFIGSDGQGNDTTLGREGSDFTAAILGNALNSDEVVLWKDVPGIMTGDPGRFAGVHKMDQVSYLEAIELSYFGAKVLHPNTIKPLQNKNIPLYINSIDSPEFRGTRVVKEPEIKFEKPVLILKENQVLISLQPRDFSFIMEEAVSRVFASLAKFNLRVNLLQHGAVSMSFCVDYSETSINNLIGDLIVDYKVLYNTGLNLLTIRHYTEEEIEKYTKGRKIYIQQQSRRTARFVLS